MESEKFAAALKEAERTAAVPVTEEEYLEADSEGAPLSAESGAGYCGSILDGRISGRGRTEQPNGLTAYDGDYMDGKRHGFGSYYYKDGALCYAGFWKDDRKDGVGVSFRNSDHALHVAPWEEGRPGKFASLLIGPAACVMPAELKMERNRASASPITERTAVFCGQMDGRSSHRLRHSLRP